MKSWYNNTLDDTVSTSVTATKQDVDWMHANRFSPTETQYASLYIASSLVKHANFPGIVSYASGKNIKMGLAYSSTTQIDTLLAYNKAQTDITKKLVYAITELEPYNTGDYTGMTEKMAYAYPKLKAAGLKHLVYMGWPTDSYWATIVANCDEINLHCYRTSADMTPSGIWGYVQKRLGLIADACKAQNKLMKVNILYSCEPSFAYDWFKANGWNAAHNIFLGQYATKATANMKAFLNVNDFAIFVSKYGKQIKPL